MDSEWKRKVERTLQNLRAEIAAVREDLEISLGGMGDSGDYFAGPPRRSTLRRRQSTARGGQQGYIMTFLGFMFRHTLVDIGIVAFIWIWLYRVRKNKNIVWMTNDLIVWLRAYLLRPIQSLLRRMVSSD